MEAIVFRISGHRIWKRVAGYVFLLFVCCSCGRMGEEELIKRRKDSLMVECDRFLMELNGDSLRLAALAYVKVTEQYSREYFRGLQYLINADFNERRYDKVLEMLKDVEGMPNFMEYPDIRCNYQYTRARALQYSNRFDEAIEAFKGCLEFDSPQDSIRERIRGISVEAMMQLLNTYQSSGRSEECVEYFTYLSEHPTPLIREYAMRDVFSFLGYSLSRTDRLEEAVKVMKQALDMPLYRPTPERRFRDYAYAASALYSSLEETEQSIEWCKQALAAAEEYEYTGGVQWVTTMLGNIYRRTGNVEEALELYRSSIERARRRGDLSGESNAYVALTELYLYWNLYEQADEYATLSLDLQLKQGDENLEFLAAACLTKGIVMQKLNRPDSALYYWHKGEEYCTGLPYTNGQVDLDRVIGALLVDSCTGDSLQMGIDRLRRSAAGGSYSLNLSIIYFQLAKGYLKQGHVQEGEVMLDSMYHALNSGGKPVYLSGAYRFALQHYLRRHDVRNIERYAAAYMDEAEFHFNEDISRKVTEAMIVYQTEKKEQQLLQARAELAVKELKLHFYVLLSVALVILLGLFVVWYLYRRRYHKIKLLLVQEHLAVVLDNLEKADTGRRKAEEQLLDLLGESESRREIAALTPAVYREDGESKFRRRFEKLYPVFLPRLRQRVPGIGRSEEMLCMLIVLGQSTEQIMDTLCIARSSVNTARYRLRRKMGLEKEVSLEEAVMELVG